ncbi:MAG: sigma-54-dependent Fis family transcriptional regulator [Deltaproteobacteria bacterium CG07_land_8_20_14_0_80_60_11]|nr:MAG: sigma-54-dependent Fis family transcriptional regulator [Deltaproteobacteria bacterium CG07_land_8_20_14_0_80_60_11]
MESSATRVLILDDDRDISSLLSALMNKEGLTSVMAHDGETALRMVPLARPDMMLVDVKMPGIDGMEVLKRVKETNPHLPVVLITAYAEISASVAAMRAGAFDYLAKPFDHSEVIRVVRAALAEGERRRRSQSEEIAADNCLRVMMGPSDAVTRIIREVNRVAQSDFSVIIQGETGSGKELVARALHQLSSRDGGPFIPLDCGAIPETLIESELFGYQKGAFTGATGPKAGKFEAAQGGTLFLDEIGNLPLASQTRLLRVLQEKAVLRLGATRPVKINVRLLTASNQELQGLVTSGQMREDLFFRLNEFTITVPPLRERKDDIPYLAKRFMDLTNKELQKNVRRLSEYCLEALLSYNWPGNVRQLRSVIRRAVLLADDIITEKHLDIKRAPVPGLAFTPKIQGTPWDEFSLREIVHRSVVTVEREVLLQVLKYTRGNKAKAARLLQIDYKTIHTKLKQFGINQSGGGHD